MVAFNILIMIPFIFINNLQTVQSNEQVNSSAVVDKTHVKVSSSHSPILSRKRRNVAQLAYLVDFFTPYKSGKLLQHGFWCGFGGDRKHDGSVYDQCDNCCKIHDYCYDALLDEPRVQEDGYVNEVIANIPLPNGKNIDFGFNLPIKSKSKKCVPYVDLYHFQNVGGNPYCTEVGGICSRRVCQCDVDFVQCLRHSRCAMH